MDSFHNQDRKYGGGNLYWEQSYMIFCKWSRVRSKEDVES